MKNVKIGPSPVWMRERLRASGVRPINNIVDITNYVMLEYGQPMHSFDFACVEGNKLIVRRARPGETIQTLDGTARSLNESMLVIADEKKPVAVAGVMGGANSEITDKTVDVFFESANFNGVSIRKHRHGSGDAHRGFRPLREGSGSHEHPAWPWNVPASWWSCWAAAKWQTACWMW